MRGTASPTPELGGVTGVTVQLNTLPGHSRLSWDALPGAHGYVVQGSSDPDAETWTESMVMTRTTFDANGATPGQQYWYRVAGFNPAGQGPWSMPTSRPVM